MSFSDKLQQFYAIRETMAKPKKKLTKAQKQAKKARQKEYMIIFVNGKQKRIKRPPTKDELEAEELMLRNACPIWLHQNELWEYAVPFDDTDYSEQASSGKEFLLSGRDPDDEWDDEYDDYDKKNSLPRDFDPSDDIPF